jgi:hypothetical protein
VTERSRIIASKPAQADPVVQKLDAILSVLQDLMILEGAKVGIKREDLRKIVAVGNNRISRVTKHVRRSQKGSD